MVHLKEHSSLSNRMQPRDTKMLNMQTNTCDTAHHHNEEQNHRIILTGTEEPFDKIQHPLMIEPLTKLSTEEQTST